MFNPLRRLTQAIKKKLNPPTPEELKQQEQQQLASSMLMLYLKRMSSLDPEDPDLRMRLAEVLEKSGQDAEAFANYVVAVKSFLAAGKSEKAFSAAQNALGTNHTSREILSLYVDAGAACKRLDEVREFLSSRIETSEDSLPYRIMQALVLEKGGQIEAAGRLYQKLKSEGVDHPLIAEGISRTASRARAAPPDEIQEVAPAPAEITEEKPLETSVDEADRKRLAQEFAEAADSHPLLGDMDEQIDAALDTLFGQFPEDEAVAEAEEILRYDVALKHAPETEGLKIRYDLGLAYKEMGLTDDAIQQFISALEREDPEADRQQTALCYSMLANSYFQLEKYDDAVIWAKKGLRYSEANSFEWKAIVYDLASALEKQGRNLEALEQYKEIARHDEGYRDISTRISDLSLQISD